MFRFYDAKSGIIINEIARGILTTLPRIGETIDIEVRERVYTADVKPRREFYKVVKIHHHITSVYEDKWTSIGLEKI